MLLVYKSPDRHYPTFATRGFNKNMKIINRQFTSFLENGPVSLSRSLKCYLLLQLPAHIKFTIREKEIYQDGPWDSAVLGGGGRYVCLSTVTLGGCTLAFSAYSCFASSRTESTRLTSASLHRNNTDGSLSRSKL